jgi:NADH-quinone oxidoreductase subunit C
MTREFYLNLFINIYKKYISQIFFKKKEKNTMYVVVKPEFFFEFIRSLNKNSMIKTKILNDICVVDYPEKFERFELSYNLLSVKNEFRILIKTYTSAYVPSLTPLFNSAN